MSPMPELDGEYADLKATVAEFADEVVAPAAAQHGRSSGFREAQRHGAQVRQADHAHRGLAHGHRRYVTPAGLDASCWCSSKACKYRPRR